MNNKNANELIETLRKVDSAITLTTINKLMFITTAIEDIIRSATYPITWSTTRETIENAAILATYVAIHDALKEDL